MRDYPCNGEGVEVFVDASDTGYTKNNEAEVKALETAATKTAKFEWERCYPRRKRTEWACKWDHWGEGETCQWLCRCSDQRLQ